MIDLKEKLKGYFPALFLLLNDDQFNWNDIGKKFTREFEKRKADYIANDNYLVVQASFFDIISASLNGRDDAVRLLSFFNNLIEELAFRIPNGQKPWLKTTLFNLLTNWDRNYLNFFGELAVLNNILKGGFILSKIEERISSGKEIDFSFSGLEHGNKLLVEVVNMHLEIFENRTDEEFILLYQKKITDKLNDKTKGNLANINFHLIPVVWGGYNDMLRLFSLYDKGIIGQYAMVIEPNCYLCYTYDSGVKYYFGGLSTMPSIINLPGSD